MLVGLELPCDEQARIDAFLASDGSAHTRAALLAGACWHWVSQDGRCSEAMVELLESIRRWRAAGAAIDVVAFDASSATGDRDHAMAERLLRARAHQPARVLLVLVGNLHARRVAGIALAPEMVPMGVHLAAAIPDLITLDAAYTTGATWCYTSPTPDGCGVHPCRGDGDAGPARVELDRLAPRDAPYHGRFQVGALTASPPAVPPDRARSV